MAQGPLIVPAVVTMDTASSYPRPIFTATREDFACPRCKADRGDRCRSPSGKLCDTPHGERCEAYARSRGLRG